MTEPTANERELIRLTPALKAATVMALEALRSDPSEIDSLVYDHDEDEDLVTVDVELVDGRKATGRAYASAREENCEPRRIH